MSSKTRISLRPLFNVQNATPTFKSLLMKYEKQNLSKDKNKIRIKNLNSIFFEIDRRRRKIELEEKESEYMFREIRKDLQLNQELVNHFGIRAQRHVQEAQKINIRVKMDKTAFLNPIKKPDKINYSASQNKKYDSQNISLSVSRNKLLTLPEIINKSQNSRKNRRLKIMNGIRKINDLSFESIKNDLEMLDKDNTINVSRNALKDLKKIPSEIKLAENKTINDEKSGIQNYTSGRVSQNFSLDNSKNRLFTDGNSFISKNNKTLKLNSDYINYLENITDKLIFDKERHKRYFYNNDYGCDISKLKYNYLKKKFFTDEK